MESIHDILVLFEQNVKKIMGESLSRLLVYGSYARGDYTENSDVDIMVLTSLPEDKIEPVEDSLYDVAYDILMEYGIQISVIVKNEEHFKYWLGALPFYDNVEREGIERSVPPITAAEIASISKPFACSTNPAQLFKQNKNPPKPAKRPSKI